MIVQKFAAEKAMPPPPDSLSFAAGTPPPQGVRSKPARFTFAALWTTRHVSSHEAHAPPPETEAVLLEMTECVT